MTLIEDRALPGLWSDVHAFSYSPTTLSPVSYELDLKPVMLTESRSLILSAVLPQLKATSYGLHDSVTGLNDPSCSKDDIA
jgi:hypothetical protein